MAIKDKDVVFEYAAGDPTMPIVILPRRYSFSPEIRDLPPQDFGEDMFDPTGFVPLEVMIEQQRIAGEKALLQRSMFDFDDYKEIYLETEKPDFDDEFSVMEYIREIEAKKQKIFEERQAEFNAEFAEFLQSKRKKNATTNLNDDAINSSTGQTQDNSGAAQAAPQVGSGETSPE